MDGSFFDPIDSMEYCFDPVDDQLVSFNNNNNKQQNFVHFDFLNATWLKNINNNSNKKDQLDPTSSKCSIYSNLIIEHDDDEFYVEMDNDYLFKLNHHPSISNNNHFFNSSSPSSSLYRTSTTAFNSNNSNNNKKNISKVYKQFLFCFNLYLCFKVEIKIKMLNFFSLLKL
jgi:hypothetical protein